MNRRQFLAASLAFTSAGLIMTGCSGGGSSDSGEAVQQARGTVALPTGMTLPPGALTVESGPGTGALGADGSFQTSVLSSSPSLAFVRHASGRPLLLGFLDPENPASTIDARSTAVALLFLGLGGWQLPVENKRDVLALLSTHAAVVSFADTITVRLQANPFALDDMDSVVASALKSAVDTILSARHVNPVVRVSNGEVTRAESAPASLLVTPTDTQSGTEVLQVNAAQTLLATNHWRRESELRLYRTGFEKEGQSRVDLDAVLPISDRISLPATNALGVFTTLSEVFNGSQATAFVPTSTPAQRLELAPDSVRTYCEAIVLGSSSNQEDPSWFSEPKYASELEDWRRSITRMNRISAFRDVIFGLVLELIGIRSSLKNLAAIEAAIANIEALGGAEIGAMLELAGKGKLTEAGREMLRLMVEENSLSLRLRQALKPLIAAGEEVVLAESKSIASRGLLRLAVLLMTTASVALWTGDLGAVIFDLHRANRADRWSATLIKPTLKLNPATAKIAKGARQTFAVNVIAPPEGGKVIYAWSVNSLFAIMSDTVALKTGKEIETENRTVELVTTPSDVGILVVTVKAYKVTAQGQRTLAGEAQAQVSFTEAPSENAFNITAGKPVFVHHRTLQGETIAAPYVWGFAPVPKVIVQSNQVAKITYTYSYTDSRPNVTDRDHTYGGSLTVYPNDVDARRKVTEAEILDWDGMNFQYFERGEYFYVKITSGIPVALADIPAYEANRTAEFSNLAVDGKVTITTLS